MSDSQGPKAKGKPSWQQQEPSSLPEHPDNTPASEQTEQEQRSEPRASLIENASEFLKDESIRDAPIERKRIFLESKGLTEPEIDNLLEMQHPHEAAAMEDDGIERQDPSRSIPPTTSQSASTSSSPEQEEPPTTPPPKDQPPIITYPEFLLHAQKPTPLITANRLLTSLYIASGAAATVYGTSKYVVEPMVSSLTSARHSLLEGAGANLDALNKKLEGAVSKVPGKARLSEKAGDENENEGSDTESLGSDGALFFRRSAGTQTSPRLSRSTSSVSVKAGEVISPAQGHTSALLGIHGKLSDLLPKDGEPRNPLRDSIVELRAYLHKLPHVDSLYLAGKAGRKGKNEAVSNVKAEIRSVKGVLLSARNFPSGVAAR